MTSCIDHAQRFITSGFKDQSAWDEAQSACQNLKIREFLNDLPLKSDKAINQADLLAESLVEDRQEVPALMVRFLTHIPALFALQSPLQIPDEQRESLFSFAQALTDQIVGHRDLLSSAGFLYLIRGTGLYELRKYPAARSAYEEALDIYRQLATEQPAA